MVYFKVFSFLVLGIAYENSGFILKSLGYEAESLPDIILVAAM